MTSSGYECVYSSLQRLKSGLKMCMHPLKRDQ